MRKTPLCSSCVSSLSTQYKDKLISICHAVRISAFIKVRTRFQFHNCSWVTVMGMYAREPGCSCKSHRLMIPWVCHFCPRSSNQLCRSLHLIFSGHIELFELREHILFRETEAGGCVCVSISLYLYIYTYIYLSLLLSLSYLSLSFYHIYLFTFFFFKVNGSHNCGGLVSQHLMGEAVRFRG